jgi:ATP-dependent Lon protease
MFDRYKHSASNGGPGEAIPLFSVSDDNDTVHHDKYDDVLPLIALKNTVLYPGLVIPITVGRTRSQSAIKAANAGSKYIAVTAQIDDKVAEPGLGDLYSIGTIAKVLKLLQMPDGSTTAILQGRSKFELLGLESEQPHMVARYRISKMSVPTNAMELSAAISGVRDIAGRIIELSPNIPSEAVMMLQNMTDDNILLNFIASNLNVDLQLKQDILSLTQPMKKAETILKMITHELQLLEIKDEIASKVKGDIDQQQKEYFLNQQLKTIQEELGQNPQAEALAGLEQRAKDKDWPEKIGKAFAKELGKARRINPQVAEYSVTLNYLELLLDLPWNEVTDDNFDLAAVKKVLDADHYGMDKIKDRILEHLAVLKLKGDMKAPILCLVGPPGVGKTSLGKSVATALGREYVRMSLGGLHDESEIRGHRKTYIGAMPGRILQSIKKAKTSNPVFILDEIDKLGRDFRGDPSSALLEVLDPEQNTTFHDNYLDLEYDLSKVLFIATANSLNSIQPALLDRMEIIQLSGYSTEEKVQIAKGHLIPKQRKNHGLLSKHVSISKPVLGRLIQDYTRESGVRSLDRTIGSVMRYVAKNVAMETDYESKIKKEDLPMILGPEKVNLDNYTKIKVPGVAVGLAWTSVGGDILFIEVSLSKGKGKLQLTGNLGDVMKESATTALSYLKAHADLVGIDPERFADTDIHIHVPQGAIPKDGPSAGVTMLSALASAFVGRPIKHYLAMTGEITLRGRVLPVGGIKEKILAAKRSGIKEVMLCVDNKKHVEEIEAEYIKGMTFTYVEQMQDVLTVALNAK